VRTGDAGEAHEALLVTVRGAVVATARRSSSGTVSFEVDDGSGPLRVVADGSIGLDPGALSAGSWIEVRGVLGQETTGAQPQRGYRIWPARAADVDVVASATDPDREATATGSGSGHARGAASLAGIGNIDLAGLTVGATLVTGPWHELDLGGLLWDGQRLVGVDPRSARLIPAETRGRPTRLELRAPRAVGERPSLGGLPLVALEAAPGGITIGAGTPHAPSTDLPRDGEGPTWTSLVGVLRRDGRALELVAGQTTAAVDLRCAAAEPPLGIVRVLGIGLAGPRLVVPCGGIEPAPSLIGATIAARSASAPPSGGIPLATASASAATADPRPAAAALLLAASAVAAVSALAARRRGDDDPDPAATEAAVGTSVGGDGEPPRLTLVALPRERGPS
jgi:hypothetical protein